MMDNQYNYYNPNENTNYQSQNQNGAGQFHGQDPQGGPQKKPGKKTPKWIKAA